MGRIVVEGGQTFSFGGGDYDGDTHQPEETAAFFVMLSGNFDGSACEAVEVFGSSWAWCWFSPLEQERD